MSTQILRNRHSSSVAVFKAMVELLEKMQLNLPDTYYVDCVLVDKLPSRRRPRTHL